MKIFNFFKSAKQFQRVALITNFNSCPLGLSLTEKLVDNMDSEASFYDKIVLISPDTSTFKMNKENDKVLFLDAFINQEEDRNRLIAMLKQENLKIQSLIHNQPFMLTP